MNINLELYHIFYVVAQKKSISLASQELYISQPAITYQIKKLEEQLGVSLFTRTKKGVSLTEEGEVLFKYVCNGIEQIKNGENALTNLKNLDCGTIRIGSSTTVFSNVLTPIIKEFHEEYPNIDIQIVNQLTVDLLKNLRDGSLDMLVLNMPMDESNDLDVIHVCDVHDTFVGNKKYYELTKGKTKLEELSNYPLLFQKNPSNTREYLDKYLKDNKVILKPKLEVVSYNLIMDLVSAGFGIGYATKEFISDRLNKDLFEIKVEPDVPKRYIGIVTLKKRTTNYSCHKLIAMIKEKNI